MIIARKAHCGNISSLFGFFFLPKISSSIFQRAGSSVKWEAAFAGAGTEGTVCQVLASPWKAGLPGKSWRLFSALQSCPQCSIEALRKQSLSSTSRLSPITPASGKCRLCYSMLALPPVTFLSPRTLCLREKNFVALSETPWLKKLPHVCGLKARLFIIHIWILTGRRLLSRPD